MNQTNSGGPFKLYLYYTFLWPITKGDISELAECSPIFNSTNKTAPAIISIICVPFGCCLNVNSGLWLGMLASAHVPAFPR